MSVEEKKTENDLQEKSPGNQPDVKPVSENPLGEKPVPALLRQFALPSIVAMLVSSLYNIVDQFFIGQSVGALGNAATNVYYPLTIACISIALLLGIGGASAFNLAMGRGDREIAGHFIGNAASLMALLGAALMAVTLIFARPLLHFFGSPDNVMPYALTYTRICAIGFPFLIFSAGGSHLIRADGSPRYSMYINLAGAVINTVLDWMFVFGFGWGMAGAAAATVIGQVVAGLMALRYLRHYKTIPLDRACFRPEARYFLRAMSLGTASFFNQMAMMVMAVVLNKSLKYYGALSRYGDAIPIAWAGIATKCMQVIMAFVIGISQGLQPIASFNYGAEKYARVKQAYFLALKSGAVITVISFILFQLFPRQIISFFGDGGETYFEFAQRYIRIYFFFIFTYFMQPITSNFFTAIGKPKKGIFLSLTRQILFYLPLLLILPMIMGIDGIMYAGAGADLTAFIVCTIVARKEIRRPEYAEGVK